MAAAAAATPILLGILGPLAALASVKWEEFQYNLSQAAAQEWAVDQGLVDPDNPGQWVNPKDQPPGFGVPQQSPHAEADALAGAHTPKPGHKALMMSRGGDNIATGWVLNGVAREDAEHIANKVAEAVARRKADR